MILLLAISYNFWLTKKKSEHETKLKEIESKAAIEHARLESYLQHYETAEIEYRKFLSQNPDSTEAKKELAKILSWEKKYDESITLYRDLLSKDPNNIQIRREYARVLIWVGKNEEAAEQLEKTLK